MNKFIKKKKKKKVKIIIVIIKMLSKIKNKLLTLIQFYF